MSITSELLIPLAISGLAVLFGSYLSFLLKLYLYAPPRIVYLCVGLVIYTLLVISPALEFNLYTVLTYTLIVMGFQEAYDKWLRRVYEGVRYWYNHRRKR